MRDQGFQLCPLLSRSFTLDFIEYLGVMNLVDGHVATVIYYNRKVIDLGILNSKTKNVELHKGILYVITWPLS